MKNVLSAISRAFLSCLLFLFICFCAESAAIVKVDAIGVITVSVIMIAVIPLIINSTVYLFYSNNKTEYESFLLKKPESFKRGQQISSIIKSLDNVINLAVWSVFLVPFSMGILSDYVCVLFSLQNNTVIVKILSAVFMLIVFVSISVFTRLFVREKWYYKINSGVKKTLHFFLSVLKYIAVYTYGMIMLTVIIEKFKIIIFTSGLYKADVFDILIWLPIIFILIKYLIVLIKRRKFIRRLKKSCTDNKFMLSKIKRPYISVFKNCEDANFTVTANGETYACRLLSGKGRGVDMILFDDGEGVYKHALKIRGIEMFSRYTQFTYGYDSKYKKCVIITSLPANVKVGEDEKTAPLYTGEKIGQYLYFEPQGFINSLERDCMERRQ